MIQTKRLITVIAFVFPFVYLSGQYGEKIVDVIYFKDGTRVEGTIVYKIPKVRVSISRHNYITEIDSVYTYPLDIITKIAREPAKKLSKTNENLPNTNNATAIKQKSGLDGVTNDTPFKMGFIQQPNEMKFKSIAEPERVYTPQPSFSFQPGTNPGKTGTADLADPEGIYRKLQEQKRNCNLSISGLRSITDYHYVQGIGNIKNNRLDLSTSLGLQFDSHLFLGLGISYNLSLNKKESSVPIFINTKFNLLDQKSTPYIGLKTGYSILGATGLYICPNIGMTFFPRGTQAINIGLGYSFQKAKYRKWSNEYNMNKSFHDDYHGLYIKLSYEINIISFK